MHKRPFVTAARVCVCVVKMFPTLNGERQKEEKYTHTHKEVCPGYKRRGHVRPDKPTESLFFFLVPLLLFSSFTASAIFQMFNLCVCFR
jgi:hypothetical protein